MPKRPAIVAFDIIETVFSLQSLRARLEEAGADGGLLDLWFARSLRDAFALAATGGFAPFREVLKTTLADTLEEQGVSSSEDALDRVLQGFTELDPHADAMEAFDHLRQAGIRIMALSNGAASATESLLQRAGLRDRVERVVSIDEVGLAKPRREVYLHAARLAGVAPAEMTLVAAHPWDIHGARSAGLAGAYVARGRAFPAFMQAPDLQADSLVGIARALAG